MPPRPSPEQYPQRLREFSRRTRLVNGLTEPAQLRAMLAGSGRMSIGLEMDLQGRSYFPDQSGGRKPKVRFGVKAYPGGIPAFKLSRSIPTLSFCRRGPHQLVKVSEPDQRERLRIYLVVPWRGQHGTKLKLLRLHPNSPNYLTDLLVTSVLRP